MKYLYPYCKLLFLIFLCNISLNTLPKIPMKKTLILFISFTSLSFSNGTSVFLSLLGSPIGSLGVRHVFAENLVLGLAHGSSYYYTNHGHYTIPITFSGGCQKDFGQHIIHSDLSVSSAFDKSGFTDNELKFVSFHAFGFALGYKYHFKKSIGLGVEWGGLWSKPYVPENTERDWDVNPFWPSLLIDYTF